MEKEFLEASQNAKRIAVVLLILVIAAGFLLIPWVGSMDPGDEASMDELARAMQDVKFAGRVIVGSTLLLWAIGAVYFVRLGYRTRKFGQYPPPGTMVFRRTRIRRDADARLIGGLCYGVAIIALIPVAVAAYTQFL